MVHKFLCDPVPESGLASLPPGVPVGIEGPDLAPVFPGNFFVQDVYLDARQGRVLHVGILFLQQQEVKAHRGEQPCQTLLQTPAELFPFPVIPRVCQEDHPQVQVAFRGAGLFPAVQQQRAQLLLRTQEISQGDPIGPQELTEILPLACRLMLAQGSTCLLFNEKFLGGL